MQNRPMQIRHFRFRVSSPQVLLTWPPRSILSSLLRPQKQILEQRQRLDKVSLLSSTKNMPHLYSELLFPINVNLFLHLHFTGLLCLVQIDPKTYFHHWLYFLNHVKIENLFWNFGYSPISLCISEANVHFSPAAAVSWINFAWLIWEVKCNQPTSSIQFCLTFFPIWQSFWFFADFKVKQNDLMVDTKSNHKVERTEGTSDKFLIWIINFGPY